MVYNLKFIKNYLEMELLNNLLLEMNIITLTLKT